MERSVVQKALFGFHVSRTERKREREEWRRRRARVFLQRRRRECVEDGARRSRLGGQRAVALARSLHPHTPLFLFFPRPLLARPAHLPWYRRRNTASGLSTCLLLAQPLPTHRACVRVWLPRPEREEKNKTKLALFLNHEAVDRHAPAGRRVGHPTAAGAPRRPRREGRTGRGERSGAWCAALLRVCGGGGRHGRAAAKAAEWCSRVPSGRPLLLVDGLACLPLWQAKRMLNTAGCVGRAYPLRVPPIRAGPERAVRVQRSLSLPPPRSRRTLAHAPSPSLPPKSQRLAASAHHAESASGLVLPPKYCEHIYKTARRPTRTIKVREEESGNSRSPPGPLSRRRPPSRPPRSRPRPYLPPPFTTPRSASWTSALSTPSACRP